MTATCDVNTWDSGCEYVSVFGVFQPHNDKIMQSRFTLTVDEVSVIPGCVFVWE